MNLHLLMHLVKTVLLSPCHGVTLWLQQTRGGGAWGCFQLGGIEVRSGRGWGREEGAFSIIESCYVNRKNVAADYPLFSFDLSSMLFVPFYGYSGSG